MSTMSELHARLDDNDVRATVGHLVCLLDRRTAFDVGYTSDECDLTHGLITLLRQVGMSDEADAMERGHRERHLDGAGEPFCPILDTTEGNRQ